MLTALNVDKHSGQSSTSPSSSSAIYCTAGLACACSVPILTGRSPWSNTECASLRPTKGLSRSNRRKDQRPKNPPPQPQPPRRIPSRSTITTQYTSH
uniref:Uncharacterized protein n=1 Tax=Pararge aegeria TaxID=116150 RepID=S4PJ36_9NEOP